MSTLQRLKPELLMTFSYEFLLNTLTASMHLRRCSRRSECDARDDAHSPSSHSADFVPALLLGSFLFYEDTLFPSSCADLSFV